MLGTGPYSVSISEGVLGRIKYVHRHSIKTWCCGPVNSGKAGLNLDKLVYLKGSLVEPLTSKYMFRISQDILFDHFKWLIFFRSLRNTYKDIKPTSVLSGKYYINHVFTDEKIQRAMKWNLDADSDLSYVKAPNHSSPLLPPSFLPFLPSCFLRWHLFVYLIIKLTCIYSLKSLENKGTMKKVKIIIPLPWDNVKSFNILNVFNICIKLYTHMHMCTQCSIVFAKSRSYCILKTSTVN